MARTVKKIIKPGKRASWGWNWKRSLESKSIRPHVGISEGKPRPRNESADSVMIAAPTLRVAATMIGLSTLGRICLKINDQRVAPIERAASTNSFSFKERKLARTRRAVGIQFRIAITITIRKKTPKFPLLK